MNAAPYFSSYIVEVPDNTSNMPKFLFFQQGPAEIEYDPQSKFIAINTLGRNNPHYHYVGSEDELKIELSWYCDDDGREDVIKNCRLLESWSKGDSYASEPKKLNIMVGNLYGPQDIWICTSAPYTMKLFHKVYQMMPMVAKQTCIFKRIAAVNRTSADIRKIGF